MLLLLSKWCIMTLWCRKNCAIKREEQSFTVGRIKFSEGSAKAEVVQLQES